MAKSKSNEKMALCIISGPLENFGLAVRDCIIGRHFQPENAVSFIQNMTLLPMDTDNPHEETLQDANRLISELDIEPDYMTFDPKDMSIGATIEYFGGLLAWLSELYEKRKKLHSDIEKNKGIIEILNHIKQVDVAMEKLLSMRAAKFRFGRVPTGIYNSSRERINLRDDLFFIHTSVEENYVYGMYFVLPSFEEYADAFMTALKFERIWISDKVHGSPLQASQQLEEENRVLAAQVAELDRLKEEKKNEEYSVFLRNYSYLRLVGDSYGYRGYAGQRDGKFYLVGWVPLNEVDEYSKCVNPALELTCSIERPEDLLKDTNTADDEKFLRLLEAEMRVKSIYDYAMEQEEHLESDIRESSQSLRQHQYASADSYIAKVEEQERTEADSRIKELDNQLEADLSRLEQHFQQQHKEWSDIIFSAAINSN